MVDRDTVLKVHREKQGKTEVIGKVLLDTMEDLSTYYTPGVAFVSEEIARDKTLAYDYTSKGNTIAIISDGTRILGLGDIGPDAGMPVMEGKSILFKRFGGVDAVPICIGTTDENEIIKLVKDISPSFGGINIEDIKSPKSISIAETLAASLDIPVLHDDRQGTGVVALAGVINSLRLAGKGKDARIVINGAGAAGYGIASSLSYYGYKNIIMADTKGAIFKGREGNDEFKGKIAEMTNAAKIEGPLGELVKGADLLIGVSVRGAFTKEHIQKMGEKPVVFALANPYPEIEYPDAKEAGAFIVATGRSDTPNQVNNVLAFPGMMRGMLDVRSKSLTDEMLKAAALAIAKGVGRRLGTDCIMPKVSDPAYSSKVVPEVAASVAEAAIKGCQARISVDPRLVKKHTKHLIKRYMRIERKVSKLI